MKEAHDIRPWYKKHKERRKVEEHPCNTVPAEMHTQMMNERDARLRGRDVEIADLKRLLSEKLVPQPAREGEWSALFYLMMAFGLGFFLAWSFFRYYPAAPKGRGDEAHWLRNDRAAYRALGCDTAHNIWGLSPIKDACKALDQ